MRLVRPGSRLRRLVVHYRWHALGLVAFVVLPWAMRLTAWWWDLAWGKGAWCARFVPIMGQ